MCVWCIHVWYHPSDREGWDASRCCWEPSYLHVATLYVFQINSLLCHAHKSCTPSATLRARRSTIFEKSWKFAQIFEYMFFFLSCGCLKQKFDTGFPSNPYNFGGCWHEKGLRTTEVETYIHQKTVNLEDIRPGLRSYTVLGHKPARFPPDSRDSC